MKLTFPTWYSLYPFRALIEGLAHEAIVPPECTQKTLALGAAMRRNLHVCPEDQHRQLSRGVGKGAEAILMAGA